MRNNKSLIIILSMLVVTSTILATNFSSPSFGQKKANNNDNGEDLGGSNDNELGSLSGDLGSFKYIKKFDSDGNYIAGWGSKGTGEGQFLHAHGIGVDRSSGDVYVSDAENYNIQKFDSNGNFITSWGSEGTGEGQFSVPESIAVDSSGNVYVADQGNF